MHLQQDLQEQLSPMKSLVQENETQCTGPTPGETQKEPGLETAQTSTAKEEVEGRLKYSTWPPFLQDLVAERLSVEEPKSSKPTYTNNHHAEKNPSPKERAVYVGKAIQSCSWERQATSHGATTYNLQEA